MWRSMSFFSVLLGEKHVLPHCALIDNGCKLLSTEVVLVFGQVSRFGLSAKNGPDHGQAEGIFGWVKAKVAMVASRSELMTQRLVT